MAIQSHNLKAAATWGSGGGAYDKVSETIADSVVHGNFFHRQPRRLHRGEEHLARFD